MQPIYEATIKIQFRHSDTTQQAIYNYMEMLQDDIQVAWATDTLGCSELLVNISGPSFCCIVLLYRH